MDKDDDDYETPGFGWWPEVFGAIAVALLIWFLVAYARGSL